MNCRNLFITIVFLTFAAFEANSQTNPNVRTNEANYNLWLSKQLNGALENRYDFETHSGEKGYISVDVTTDDYVIEGGIDKRSSLDSIQQALFASVLSGKKPAVAIYDTDNFLGKFEFRIFSAAKKAKIDVFWVRNEKITFLNNSK